MTPGRPRTPAPRYSREQAAAALQRVADRWPADARLLSWSGTLLVVPVEDISSDGVYTDRAIQVTGISNDGGDMDERRREGVIPDG